jgi:hypothetical protein
MKAIETASSGIHSASASEAPEVPAVPRPGAEEVTNWLLDGRFFTIDTAGAIASWSPVAAETFGWRRQDVLGQQLSATLLAPHAQALCDEKVEALFSQGASDGSVFTGDVDAVDVEDRALTAAFAMVPIQLGAGYEFNSLLQEISSRSRDGESNAELKARHASVLSLIEGALVGKPERTAFAGALVVFRSGPPGSAPQVGDNVVSIAEVGSRFAVSRVSSRRRDGRRSDRATRPTWPARSRATPATRWRCRSVGRRRPGGSATTHAG